MTTLFVLETGTSTTAALRHELPSTEVVAARSTGAAAANGYAKTDCVIVAADVTLEDAAALISDLRLQPTAIAAVPVVLLCGTRDEGGRLAAFRTGADAVLPWPLSIRELVAHLEALLSFAKRMREVIPMSSTRSMATPRTEVAVDAIAPCAGMIDVTTIASLLAIIDAKELSGELSVGRSEAARVRLILDIARGKVTGGRLPGETLSGVDAVEAVLQWSAGHYTFVPRPDGPVASAEPVTPLVAQTVAEPSRQPETSIRRPEPAGALKPGPRPPLFPVRRATLQSQPAITGAQSGNPRRVPSVVVEAATQKGRGDTPIEDPAQKTPKREK